MQPFIMVTNNLDTSDEEYLYLDTTCCFIVGVFTADKQKGTN